MGKKLSDTIRNIVETKEQKKAEVVETTTADDSNETVIAEAEAPKAHPSDAAGASRMTMIKDFLNAFTTMPKSNQVDFFNQMMATMHGDFGAKDNAASNRASIDTKGDAKSARTVAMKEDVAELFGDDNLSEEFKEKASTLFEAALAASVAEKAVELEEAYELALEEEVKEINEALTEMVKNTLDNILEQWLEDNKLAFNNQIKTEVVEDFLVGMKNLFIEHYIEIPDEKIDVVESLSSSVEELEEKLNTMMTENIELKNSLLEIEKVRVFDEVTEGLTVTQVERFRSLAESVNFDGDLDAFKRKLNIVKENYFKSAPKKPVTSSVILDEIMEENSGGVITENIDPVMKRYLEVTSRVVKK